MISERFRALLSEAPADAVLTGVVRWDVGSNGGQKAVSGRRLAEAKGPLLRRVAREEGVQLNDLDALPCVVLRASASRWRRLLAAGCPELEDTEVILDANFEIQLTEPVARDT